MSVHSENAAVHMTNDASDRQVSSSQWHASASDQ